MTKNIPGASINFLLLLLLISCNATTKPYLQHELSFKKISGECSEGTGKFSMNSNTNGERYQFEQCLDADFDKTRLDVERKGDTVVISFKNKNGARALYELTVDIDTYPRYNFLTIGEHTFAVVPAAN